MFQIHGLIQEGDSGYYIVEEECISCQMCNKHCPENAIFEN
ncbi:4Fe-4S binding protein [Holdemania filiformis]